MPHDVDELVQPPPQQMSHPSAPRKPLQKQQHFATATGLPGSPAQPEHEFATISSTQQTPHPEFISGSWLAPQSQIDPTVSSTGLQYNFSSHSADPIYHPAAAFPVPSLPLDTTLLSHMPTMGFEHPMFASTQELPGTTARDASDDLPMSLQMLLGTNFVGDSGDTPPELHMTQPPIGGAASDARSRAAFGSNGDERGGRGGGRAEHYAGMGRGIGRGGGAAALAGFSRGGFAGGASG